MRVLEVGWGTAAEESTEEQLAGPDVVRRPRKALEARPRGQEQWEPWEDFVKRKEGLSE